MEPIDLERRIAAAERIARTPWRTPVSQPREFWVEALDELTRLTVEASGGRLSTAEASTVVLSTPRGGALYEVSVRAQPAPAEARPEVVEPSPASAIGKLAQIAKALREDEPSLTRAQAMAKAVTRNPAIYDDYVAGQ
jgi:hypothetical protein